MNQAEIIPALDKFLSKHNPCRIREEGGKNVCNGGTPCCHGCKFLGKLGCTVQSIACKFYVCDIAWGLMTQGAQEEMRNILEDYDGPLYFRHDGGFMQKEEFSAYWAKTARYLL